MQKFIVKVSEDYKEIVFCGKDIRRYDEKEFIVFRLNQPMGEDEVKNLMDGLKSILGGSKKKQILLLPCTVDFCKIEEI